MTQMRRYYYEEHFDEVPERRGLPACQCFAPGEVAGTCPGPDWCPLCQDDDEDAGDELPFDEPWPLPSRRTAWRLPVRARQC